MNVRKLCRVRFPIGSLFAVLSRQLLLAALFVLGLVANASAQQSVLTANQWLMPGEYLTSPNGNFRLAMQTDGNLALYDMRYAAGVPWSLMWHTGTYMYPGARAVMQTDGNFVVYDAAVQYGQYYARWHANVVYPGASLHLQNDGNLVIYGANGSARWHTNTPRYVSTQTVDGFTPLSAPSSITASAIVGTLPISHTVDIRGGVSVSIPLDVPKGVNGVAPKLSLTLSSSGSVYGGTTGNSTWSLGGIASIDSDGEPRLSGLGKLVPEILNPPSSTPQTYRVRWNPKLMVSEQRIQGQGGYAIWYQGKEDGKTYRYGRDPDAVEFDSNGAQKYYLQEVEDEFGNSMLFNYLALADLYAPKVPVLIRYGGYRVELAYNLQFGQAKLHTIKIKVGTTPVSEYRIIPGTVVDSVQKCGYDTSGNNRVCLPPVTAQWTTPATQRKQLRLVDGLGNKTDALFAPRTALASAGALFAASEIPFPMPALGAFGEFSAQPGFDGQWVAIQLKADNGLGGVNVSDFSYRSAELKNDTVRQRLVDGTYLYASHLPDVGYQGSYSGQLSKRARYTAIAGTSGAKKLSFEENTWELLTWDKYGGAQPNYVAKYPVLTKSKKHLLDDAGTIVGGTYSDINYNGWNTVTGLQALIIATESTGFDASGESITALVQKSETTTTTYANNTLTGILGFPTTTTTETSVFGQIGSKGIRIERTPYSSVTSKVGTETIFANNGGGYLQQSTVTTQYDSKGNPSSVTVTGSDFATRSTTLSSYVDDRYVGLRSQPTGTGYTLQNTMAYDRRFGTPTSIIDNANNLTVSTTRDQFGSITQETDSNGTISTTVRAPCIGSCGSFRSFDGAMPRFKITATMTHPLEAFKGAPTQISYLDSLGHVIRVETEGFASGQWNAVDTLYNSLGQVWKVSLPYQISAGQNPQYAVNVYDLQGRPTSISRPDGSSNTFVHQQQNSQYRLTKTENIVGLGGARTVVRVEEYDSLSQLKKSYDAFGSAEQVVLDYKYEHNGNVDWVRVNGNDNTAVYSQFDAFGRVLSVEDPNTGLVSFTYDKLGQLRYRMAADGTTTRFDYDAIGRVFQRIDDLGGARQTTNSWVFDSRKVGHLSSRSNSGFSEEYYYDSLAKVYQLNTSINASGYSGGFSSTITRDFYGRVLTQAYPSGVVAGNTYNERGYVKEARDARTNALLARIEAINAFGRVTQQSFGNGLATTRSSDPLSGRLTGIQTSSGVQNQTYDWWSDGTLYRRSRANIGATETFSYDGLNRLDYTSTSTPSGPRVLDYSYDALGNLTYKSEGASNATGYSYLTPAKPHRMNGAVIGGSTHQYNYDPNGSVTLIDAPGTADDRSLIYDTSGKTISITKGDPNAPTARDEFKYDPDGARFLRTSLANGVTSKIVYLYSGAFELVLPGNGSLSSIAKTYLDGVIHSRQTTVSGSTELFEYVHTDHLGSVDVVTSAAGAIVDTNSFDPYGGRRSSNWFASAAAPSVTTQQLHTGSGFTGHEHLYETGLIHMNGRVYDPTLGRFLSADPYVQAPTYSQSYNRYAYVFNDPLSATDPSGFESCDQDELAQGCTNISYGNFGVGGFGMGLLGTNLVAFGPGFPVSEVPKGRAGYFETDSQGRTRWWRYVERDGLEVDLTLAAIGAMEMEPPVNYESGIGLPPGVPSWAGTSGICLGGCHGFEVGGRIGPMSAKQELLLTFIASIPAAFVGGPETLLFRTGAGSRPFAMGLGSGLDDFARARNATTWKQFDDPINWKGGVWDKLADPSTRVHFNLDGVDIWPGVSRAAGGRGGATDWELMLIKQNPQFWDSIDFWRNGTTVGNPFK